MKTDYQQGIIAHIRKLRESKGVNQAQIAKILGISSGQIGNIESYKYNHKYTLKQLSIICEVLDYSLQRLLCGQEDPSYADFINSLIKYQEK